RPTSVTTAFDGGSRASTETPRTIPSTPHLGPEQPVPETAARTCASALIRRQRPRPLDRPVALPDQPARVRQEGNPRPQRERGSPDSEGDRERCAVHADRRHPPGVQREEPVVPRLDPTERDRRAHEPEERRERAP